MGAVCKVRGIYRYFCDVGHVLDIFAKRAEVLDVLHQGGDPWYFCRGDSRYFCERVKFSILFSRDSILDIFTQGEIFDIFHTGGEKFGKGGKFSIFFG